jgi:biopolymer transport protein TolR
MAMSIDAGEGPKSEPNVVPMIDIMLVLLIIFMIVTPVITAGFQAQMPQGKNLSSRPENQGDVILGIDNQGHYFLDPGTGTVGPVCTPGARAAGSCVERDRLTELLQGIYANRATDKILYFKADQNLQYSKIEGAIQIAQKAGVRVLAAVTEEKQSNKKKGMFGR